MLFIALLVAKAALSEMSNEPKEVATDTSLSEEVDIIFSPRESFKELVHSKPDRWPELDHMRSLMTLAVISLHMAHPIPLNYGIRGCLTPFDLPECNLHPFSSPLSDDR